MGALSIGTAVFASISLGLLLAALASDYWVIGSEHTGLWRFCRGLLCHTYGMDVQDYIHATRAFLLMGAIAGAASFFVLWALVGRFYTGSVSAAKLAAIASLVAGLCALISMSIFTGVYNNTCWESDVNSGRPFCLRDDVQSCVGSVGLRPSLYWGKVDWG